LLSLELLLLFVILFGSLSFHEAAHAWSANRLGDSTARQLGRLTLNPLAHIDLMGTVLFPLMLYMSGLPVFGWAKPVPVNVRKLGHPRRDFAMVALAGPVSNLVLAFVAASLLSLVYGSTGAVGIHSPEDFLTWVILVNVLLAVFNMIPVPPLDGGNVLAGFVPEPVARLIDAVRPWGFVVLLGLMFTGVLWRVMDPVYSAVLRFFGL
jgi:Zn-dependent protease